jgi:hypothetical protein
MTRDEYRRQTVAGKATRLGIGGRALLLLSSPALVVMFLGDILSAPFVARRHQSMGHWLIFMFARIAGPVIVAGIGLGYLVRRCSSL